MKSRRDFLCGALAAVAVASPYRLVATCDGLRLAPAAARAQGKGQGKGKGGGEGKGKGGGSGKGQGDGAAASNGEDAPAPDAAGGIVHKNGMRETIRDGRYEMRDAQGRRIVNRTATPADYLRLRLPR